jgi:hypothetical protein
MHKEKIFQEKLILKKKVFFLKMKVFLFLQNSNVKVLEK